MFGYARKRRLYESLPRWIQASVCLVPFPLLAGRAYRSTMARHSQVEAATRRDILDYQSVRLGELLRYAVDQVPAYEGLKSAVDRMPPFEALKAFPMIDKDALQADMTRYLPRCFDRVPHYECATGGTSGNQLKFFLDDTSQSVETAFLHRLWRRVGYSWRARKATFRGVEFPGIDASSPWQPNPIYNEMQFSPYHLGGLTIDRYIDKLIEFRPEFMHGYPSAISTLVRLAEAAGRSLHDLGVKAVFLASEPVFLEQRSDIERLLGTRVFSFYGHSERVILGGECEQDSSYHNFPDYGILEIVDTGVGTEVQEGETGELVGTGLLNRSLPLIRYRTGDHARRLASRCACGRAFDRFDQVEGRWGQEYVVGKSGANIYTAALNMHGPFFSKVMRYQYFQRRAGHVELRLMVAPGFTDADSRQLVAAFARKLGTELDIEPVVVDQIPLTTRGKLRRVVREPMDVTA